jgi:hypothetical protein
MRTIFCSALIAFCLAGFTGASQGAQRKVLTELQTSTTCAPCYNADVYYFQSWLSGYIHAQRVITIAHHVWWPSPGNDPMYLANSATIQTRVNYYMVGGSTYAPRMYIDGFIDGNSGYTTWPGLIDGRLQTTSPISIAVTGFHSGDTLSMTARVYAEAQVNSSNWRVHWALLQDSIGQPQNSGSGYVQFIHDAVNRAMYPDANGSPISISQGQAVEIQKSIVLNGSWVARKCRVVVFVQDNTDKQVMNAEVAKVSDLPAAFGVAQGWNLVSVPVTVNDYRRTSVFPSSTSFAYAYDQATGYVRKDTLKNGPGYWLQFGSSRAVGIGGLLRDADTIDVKSGWNMIGSISHPAITDSIVQIPTGIVASNYYGYNGAYINADTLKSGMAYWVRVNQNGKLLLR